MNLWAIITISILCLFGEGYGKYGEEMLLNSKFDSGRLYWMGFMNIWSDAHEVVSSNIPGKSYALMINKPEPDKLYPTGIYQYVDLQSVSVGSFLKLQVS